MPEFPFLSSFPVLEVFFFRLFLEGISEYLLHLLHFADEETGPEEEDGMLGRAPQPPIPF